MLQDFSFDTFSTIFKEFQLGHLMTESPHPDTRRLSFLSQSNLEGALSVFQKADLLVFENLRNL